MLEKNSLKNQLLHKKNFKKLKETVYFAIHKETNTKIAKKYKKILDSTRKRKKSRSRALVSRAKNANDIFENDIQSFKTLLQNYTYKHWNRTKNLKAIVQRQLYFSNEAQKKVQM